MLQGTKAGREPAAPETPHLAMKDQFFDWPFDDLGQFIGDLELKAGAAAPPPREAPASPRLSG
jgi:hypothetical protein